MKITINNINSKKYRVLSGVDLGNTAREYFGLDKLDREKETVIIVVPDDVISVNSSFFSGLFQDSIKMLGEQAFREHYKFECDEIISMNIQNGIFNIVKTLDLLGGQS